MVLLSERRVAMFGSGAKTPFGTGGTFGSTSSSLFGPKTQASAFGTQTSAFGTPSFGSNTTSAFGSGSSNLFGSGGGSLFSQTTTQPSTGFSFGQNSGGLFGSSSQQSSLFQTPQTSSAFGGQTFGGFGNNAATTTASSGLFGSTFGSTTTNPTGGGLFGTSSAFGGAATSGTTVKFNPVTSNESVNKNGTSMVVQTKHQCISVMKEYEAKSLEELRMEDYTAGRKSGSATSSLFGSTSQQPQQSIFGSTTGSGFGQNKPATFGGFGQPTTTTSSIFGQTSQSSNLFGKPVGTGSIFGSTTTTTNSGNSLGTGTGLFGQPNTGGSIFGSTSQPSGLFGASSGFGTTQTTSTGTGLFGTGTSTFGQPTQQAGGLFGATSKPFGFGAASSATNTFGTNTFGAAGSTGLFGSTASSKPAFSFNTSGTSGFGSSLGSFGTNTSLGGTGLFGASATANAGGGLFGGQNKTGLGTGTTLGLGTGLGAAKPFGSIGGLGATTGLGATQGVAGLAGVDQGSFAAFQQQQVLQQQLKALANSPFGDSPLFRNLTATRKRDEKVSAVASTASTAKVASHYKVFSKPSIKVRMKASPFSPSTKAKLFDKLEDDYSYADTSLTPKRNIKKLTIKEGSKGLLNGSVGNSPLRLRSLDDDDEELLARVPVVPTVSRDESHDDDSVRDSTAFVGSPVLQKARKKVTVDTSINSQVEADLTGETNDAGENSSDGGSNAENPCGVLLERPEYYTIPSLDELNEMVDEKDQCLVENFIVGREDYGEVKFLGVTDVKDLNLDEIVSFRRREAEVYPDNYDGKPEVGKELNKRSEISLHKVWPNDKTSLTPIKSPQRLKRSGFIERLEEKTSAMGALFLDYKPHSGTWIFQVEHFTRYGLDEQLFEEEGKGEILKKLKMAGEMKAETLRNEIELKKQKAMLMEEAKQKEKARILDAQTIISESVYSDEEDSHTEDEAESGEVSMIEEEECQGKVTYDTTFSSSIQNAKISGVNPERLQGMKALLFDDEEDFLSPKEKSILANRSLIADGIREAQLKQRFDTRKQSGYELRSLEYSLPSETRLTPQSPSKVMKRSKLLKSAFSSEELGLQEKQSETSLLSFTPKSSQEKLQPRIATTVREPELVSYELSTLANKQGQVCDAGLVNGRRFRVGWAPKLCLLHVGESKGPGADAMRSKSKDKQILFGSRFVRGRTCSDFNLTIRNFCIGNGSDDKSYVLDCLKNSLQHSKIDTEKSNAPFIETVNGIEFLHKFADMTEKYRELSDENDFRYQHGVVWDLVKALWGNLDCAVQANASSYHLRISRRAAVSSWLSKVLARDIDREAVECKAKDAGHLDAIFSLLSGLQVEKACEIAYENREYRMALLLSQASGDSHIKHLLREQLGEWIKQGADKFIDTKRLKIYQLLSGLMVGMTSHGDINLCNNLDWKRSFGLHLWYYCSTTVSIAKALEEYQNAYKGTDSYSAYAAPPKPCYIAEKFTPVEESDGDTKIQAKDICFHLLKLFSKRSHGLEAVLCPNTHTSDPLDYQLCWPLQQVLESLGYIHLSEAYHGLIQTSFAAQLVTCGLWEWAIFILLHIRDDKRREVAVRELLFRHCEADNDCNKLTEKEALLIESMQVPPQWIYEAKAMHARYCVKSYDEAVYLLKAGQWNEAHRVIVAELAADAIIDEEYQTLRDLLAEISPLERSCSVKNWKQSGQVFLDYILLRQKLMQIEKGEIVASTYNLEDLRGDITSLICMIGNLKADNPKERLAQAEMGKTASNLLKVVLSELSEQGLQIDEEEEIDDRKYAWSMCEVAPYIATLPLPPDYIQQELGELVCNTQMDYNEDSR